ncbi:MAG: serine/threonine-protein kinase [Planctomycetales bacterium]|nr:serine/threonine-protein kinase [Planctomycetales bacterium]
MGCFLADFGLAKLAATGSRLTRTGEALGTPAYMSPEQARGEVASLAPATDIWSLGCVLHEMLAGRPPFDAETPAAVIGQVLAAEPPRLRGRREDLPAGLEGVVRACLAKDPVGRYRAASGIRDDLERILRGDKPAAGARLLRPRAAALGLLVGAAILAAAVASGGLASRVPGRDAPLVGPSGDRSESDGLVARARAIRGSDPGRASELLRNALSLAPDRHELRIERGLLLWAAGDGEGAHGEWRTVPARAPEAAWARLYAGLEAFFRLEGQEARPNLLSVAEVPGPIGQLARGALRAMEQEWPRAREEVREAPGWEASLLRGYLEGEDPAGDKARSAREYGAALEEGIPFAWVFNNRGTLRQAQGDSPGALEDYDSAIRVNPRQATAHVNRGGIRYARGDLAGALEDYERALHLNPGYAKAWNSRGALRQARGDVAGAIEDYSRAVELEPGYAKAWFNRGMARHARGDVAGAIEDYDRALDRDPGDADAWNNRGVARNSQGSPAGALEDFERALAANPRSADARHNRGGIRLDRGEVAAAIEDFEKALDIAPPDWPNRGAAERNLARARAALEAARGPR